MNFEDFLKKKPSADTPFGKAEGVNLDTSMPEQKPNEQELEAEGAKVKQRTDWWDQPNYTQAVEAQRKAAMEAVTRDVNRAKRQRDAALITDMADVFTRMVAQRGNGAWMMPQVENRAGAANEAYNNALRRKDGLAVDYDGKLFQARVQDFQNKRKQQQADREYALAVGKAQRETEQQQFENALAVAKMKAETEQRALDNQLKQGKISEQEYRTKRAEIAASYEEKVQQSRIAKNYAGTVGEFIAYDAEGKEHRFRSEDAAKAFARQQGTWEDIESTSTTVKDGTGMYGMPEKTTTTTTRVTGGKSVKPEGGGKTMPGVNKDNKKMPGVK